MDLGGQESTGGEVDRVFGLVGEMGGAILHLGDAGVGIGCRLPVLIGQFLALAFAVKADDGGGVYRFLTGFPHECFDVVEVGGAGIFPGQAFEGGIGFDGGRVNTGSIGGDQPLPVDDGQDALEGSPVDLHGQALPPDAEAGMVRRRFMKGNAQERPQGEPVLTIPGDGPIRGEPLQVADEQHPEIDSGRNGGSSLAGKAWGAEVFCPGVEAILGEKIVEPGVKGMPLALGKLMLVDPHRLLFGFASTNRHTVLTPCCEMVNAEYRTWRLGQ